MKLPSLILAALVLLVCSSHALDKAKYAPIAEDMMKFPNHPTEAEFRAIESKMAGLPALDSSDDDHHAMLISAAFLVGGHDRHGWAIGADSQIGKAALEILSGKGKVAAWVRDDKAINDEKLDVWWMSYLGSQDEAYLFKILKYAGDPVQYHDTRALWVSLASWSFKSNCQQIKGVRDFAERRLNDPAYKDRQVFLRSCLETHFHEPR